MEFLYWDVRLDSHDVVVVTLDAQANVMLLDSSNFARYRRGEDFTYYGGLAKASPCGLRPPHPGSWYVVADRGGNGGSLRASMSVIRN